MSDVFPPNNAEFNEVQKQLLAAVGAAPDKYGVAPAAVTAALPKQAAWNVAHPAAIAAASAYHTAIQAEQTARSEYEVDLRGIAKTAHAHPGITPELITAAALHPHATTRTRIAGPTTRPVGRIVVNGLVHEVHVTDETTPHKRGKPAHYHACEYWLKIGDPAPVDPSGCLLVASKTRSPETYTFGSADTGKTAYWFFRWVGEHEERGPWSALASAKIGA